MKTLGRRRGGNGPFIYDNYVDNHVIYPGRESALKAFVDQEYGGLQHKRKNAHSANSEDALTWSCFDVLRRVDVRQQKIALARMWELALPDQPFPAGLENGDVKIEIGKTYGVQERTEVDVSIEGDGILILIEAKLYSAMSQADLELNKPHNQIARKLRVGLCEAAKQKAEFYFLILDLAPLDQLRRIKPRVSLADAKGKASGFGGKWLTAYWFSRYMNNATPLQEILDDAPEIQNAKARDVARNMGWLNWADVFKIILRSTLAARPA